MKNPSDGFTLVEIIMVLVILGIFSSVAIGKYYDMADLARIQTARGALAEVQARINLTFAQWLLEKNIPSVSVVNGKAQKGIAVSTRYTSAWLGKNSNKRYDYKLGLPDTMTRSDWGTIGGWYLEMDSGSPLYYCEKGKTKYQIKAMALPGQYGIHVTGDPLSVSGLPIIDASAMKNKFIISMPACE